MFYPSFNSIERLENIYCIITEKIDGINSLIGIDRLFPRNELEFGITVKFGSCNRYITYENDNAGFANFFKHYEEKFKDVAVDIITTEKELAEETLTECQEQYPIRIYGEWFGSGIQRGYGLKDKFFMPFSTYYAEKLIEHNIPNVIKPCIIYKGKFSEKEVNECINLLQTHGSVVVPGYMKPEGVVIHFPNYNIRLKKIIEYSELPKKKTEHDIKPESPKCNDCSKNLYNVNDGSGIEQCVNIYCKQYFKKDTTYTSMCNRESDTLYLGE